MTEKFVLYKQSWVYLGSVSDERQLSRKECRQLLKKGGWMVRNTYNFDTPGKTGFWFVIKDSFGGMEELSSKMRNQVRRSMANYTFRKMTREELLQSGYPVHRAAAEGYRVKCTPPSEEEYRQQLLSNTENEFWGAFDRNDGHLAAFAKNIVFHNSCSYSTLKAYPDELSRYPYYGLIYTMNQHYLQECGLQFVNDGARSVTNHSNMQPFLIQKFHFRKAYCNLKITYRPPLGLCVKMLYPFRKHIPSTTVRNLLYLEEMTR